MNHHDLFIKLMDRNILVNLLSLLENWFSLGVILRQMGVCCVKICWVIMRGSAGWRTLVPFLCDLYRQRWKNKLVTVKWLVYYGDYV